MKRFRTVIIFTKIGSIIAIYLNESVRLEKRTRSNNIFIGSNQGAQRFQEYGLTVILLHIQFRIHDTGTKSALLHGSHCLPFLLEIFNNPISLSVFFRINTVINNRRNRIHLGNHGGKLFRRGSSLILHVFIKSLGKRNSGIMNGANVHYADHYCRNKCQCQGHFQRKLHGLSPFCSALF